MSNSFKKSTSYKEMHTPIYHLPCFWPTSTFRGYLARSFTATRLSPWCDQNWQGKDTTCQWISTAKPIHMTSPYELWESNFGFLCSIMQFQKVMPVQTKAHLTAYEVSSLHRRIIVRTLPGLRFCTFLRVHVLNWIALWRCQFNIFHLDVGFFNV